MGLRGCEVFCCSDAGLAGVAARKGNSRARRRRGPASWVKSDSSFLELVRSAWLEGVQQVEFEVEAQLDGAIFVERQAAEHEHVSERELSCGVPAVVAAATAASAIVVSPAPETLKDWRSDMSDLPADVLESARALAQSSLPAGLPVLAGLPLPLFWWQLKALSKKEDPSKPFQRMLQFRDRHKWPLTISEGDVGRALQSHAFQFLPAQSLRQRHVLTCSLRNMDTKLCSVEEYQMLAMFIFEAAFRAVGEERGPVVIIDLRDISPTLVSTIFASLADITRGIAMCSGTLPLSIAHVQVIEATSSNRFQKYMIGMLMSKLGSKMLSRINRGDIHSAVKAVGACNLPQSLGGERDGDSEFRSWLATWRAEESALGLRL